MTTVWKIAPGDHANDWDVFRDNQCIGIGWLPDDDYRDFPTEDDILAALEKLHGPNSKGNGRGAARMVQAFVNEIENGDVVVANNAYNEVVGIGIVNSEYLPPNARTNPLRGNPSTYRRHVRLVDWVVAQEAYVPGRPSKKYFFVQQTLKRLSADDIDWIVAAYVNSSPADSALAKRLKSTFRLKTVPRPNSSVVTYDVDITSSAKGEARKRLVQHIVRERDPKIIAAKKKAAKTLACEICGFDSESVYGIAYCEVHHRKPLASLAEGTKTALKDLAILCANCHRIVHSMFPPYKLKDVRKMVTETNGR